MPYQKVVVVVSVQVHVWGDPKRVGAKLTPSGGYNDMGESDEEAAVHLYSHLIKVRDVLFILVCTATCMFMARRSGRRALSCTVTSIFCMIFLFVVSPRLL